MWLKGRWGRLGEFVRKARELGFTEIELDAFVTPEMLAELPQLDIRISSIHAPSPRRSLGGRPHTEFLLSSLDDEERRAGVKLAVETVRLAADLGARAVVLHMGSIPPLRELEEQLRRLYEEGKGGGPEYKSLKEELEKQREKQSPPFVEKAVQSLREIIPVAQALGVILGLENRVYFHEIPSPEEMELLLSDSPSDVTGYWHDTGHAMVMERLGFYPQEEWFNRFGFRMTGCHLHDVRGIHDHYPPGKGELDWRSIANNLHEEAIRVCEIGEWNSEESLNGVLVFLQHESLI